MGKVGDHRPVHFEVDLDGRTAELGMRRGAGVGGGEASEPGYVAGQFDDALVVDVVQHKIEVSAPRRERPWRGGRQSYIWVEMAEIQSVRFPRWSEIEANSAAVVLKLWDSGVRRHAAPSAGDTPASSETGRTELTWTH